MLVHAYIRGMGRDENRSRPRIILAELDVPYTCSLRMQRMGKGKEFPAHDALEWGDASSLQLPWNGGLG